MGHNRSIRYSTMAAAVGMALCGVVGYASSASASSGAISGVVRDQQGRAVAGAQVQLGAFAVNKAGVREISLETVTSDASGAYTLPAPSASQTASLAGVDGGTINYDVAASFESGGVFESATTTAPAGAAVAGASASARRVAGLSATGGIDLTVKPMQLADGAAAKVGTLRPNVGVGCQSYWKSTGATGTYNVIIGEPHAYIGMSVQYTYQQNATTTIGIAYSANGGGWSGNGSASSTYTGGSSLMTAPSPIHYAPYVYGQFLYAKQQQYSTCTGALKNYRIVPTSWTGGATISGNLTAYDGGNSPIWKYDQSVHKGYINEPAGVTFTKTAGTGATYSGGVSFAGISLTSNTTYSSSVTYKWVMNSNTSIPHYLFGANGIYPAQNSGAPVVYSN